MRIRVTLCIATLGLAVAHAVANPRAAVTIEDASVERSADGRAVVRWSVVPSDAPVDVTIDGRVISDDDRDGRHELSAAQAARRPLVHLKTPSGADFVTAERLLPLQGGRNFRDLGGYRTTDGRLVKWGKVYRSGTMANLTDDDYAFLSRLGIRVICDFRANDEREREPTVWKTTGAKVDYHTRDYKAESSLTAAFSGGMPTAATMQAAMTHFYGDLAYEHADSYRTMFKALTAGEIPLAFNCSAGKDRTGVAAALLLTLLGVPRDTVIADYALSERLVDYEAQYAKSNASKRPDKAGPYDSLAKMPAHVRAPLLRSDPAYILRRARIDRTEGRLDRRVLRARPWNHRRRSSAHSRTIARTGDLAPHTSCARIRIAEKSRGGCNGRGLLELVCFGLRQQLRDDEIEHPAGRDREQ